VPLRDAFYKVFDLTFRFRNYFRRKWQKRSLFSNSPHQSDSEVTYYESAVDEILSSQRLFKRFRRIYDYREILEHVDYKLGLKYLSKIESISPEKIKDYDDFKDNDILGKPRTYEFPKVGKTSPTTLRYVAVASEIEKIFENEKINSIAEIGAGYGGQALILAKTLKFSKYYIFDLPSVQVLIDTYLAARKVDGISFPDIHDIDNLDTDLVISNYAFSELPKELQKMYLNRVLKHAKNGYLLMNSGRTNISGRSTGKVTIDEIRSVIPNIEIFEEIPLTGPDNYLLIWKSSE
jgi:putative sugar O-methyltransferase